MYSDFLAALFRKLLRPREEVFQEVHAGVIHVLWDFRQQMLQILVDLQVVCLGGLHQTVDGCAGFGTVDGVNDVPVGATNGKGADSTLRCGVVDRNIPILQEYFQVFLLVYTVV